MACGCYAYSVYPRYVYSSTRCHKKCQQTVTINRRVRCRQIWEQMFFFFAPKQQEVKRNMKANWRDYIVSTPDILRGKPRIKGTRIPVSLILGYLAADQTADQIITEFPDLQKAQILACLDYARELAEVEAAA